MSIQTNSTTIDPVPALLKRVEKTFEETFEDVSSAKDVITKMIDHLMNQFPLSPLWEQELYDRFSQLDHRYCDFRSIRDELDQINRSLRQHTVEPDQDNFHALSETERNIIGKVDGGEDPLVESLRMSYEFFYRQLKHDPRICLFLAIFPGKAILRKRLLIYWWIGEGLVRNEDEGKRVFKELLDLHLLLPHRTDNCPRVSKCKILPWIRYMLISEANKEKLLNLKDNIPRFDPALSRRTCLIADHTNLAGDLGESTLETLRTIFNVNERYLDFQHQWLAKLKRLAVLQLGRWQVSPTHHIEVRDESFLTGLKTQKLLKYLSLRGISRITSLPDSIKELVSLKILDLKACHNLENLPAAIASLTNLTHLDVSECYLLESLPKGLENLTSLQVLKGFVIGNSRRNPIKIEHLRSLTNLKRFSIHVGSESEASVLKEGFSKLKDLEKVKCLKISWGKVVQDEEYSLSFPPGLQKLDLEGIPHETKPEWLKPSNMRNLKRLCIKGGKLRNLFDDEGEQWNTMKYLVLKFSDEPQVKVKNLKSSIFPSLKYVKMVKWLQNGEPKIIHEWNKDGQ